MAIARLVVVSEIRPMIGVQTAPPTMAIMMNDPPNFVFTPNPLTPRAKIVGNISDIKKLVVIKDHPPIPLGKKTAIETKIILMMLKIAISLEAGIIFIKAVEAKRPTPNNKSEVNK